MIRNQWYVVLESDEVKARPVGVTRLGEKMVFWRDQAGKVHAAVDRFPHRGVALSVGKIKDDHLQCPFHGFEFDTSVKCVLIPANGRDGVIPNAARLNTYSTYEAHGLIWLWWGKPTPNELPAPEFFDNLDDTYYYGSARDPWMRTTPVSSKTNWMWFISRLFTGIPSGAATALLSMAQWSNGRAIRCSTPMYSTV